MMVTKYGACTFQLQPGPVPTCPVETPRELRPVEHRVGYSEVLLENGDLIRVHLFIDEFIFSPQELTFSPSYRVVPEVVKRSWNGCEPLGGQLS